jgi:hypothetical protein
MRGALVAGMLGVLLAAPAFAQALPAPFENGEGIVCLDEKAAV